MGIVNEYIENKKKHEEYDKEFFKTYNNIYKDRCANAEKTIEKKCYYFYNKLQSIDKEKRQELKSAIYNFIFDAVPETSSVTNKLIEKTTVELSRFLYIFDVIKLNELMFFDFCIDCNEIKFYWSSGDAYPYCTRQYVLDINDVDEIDTDNYIKEYYDINYYSKNLDTIEKMKKIITRKLKYEPLDILVYNTADIGNLLELDNEK